MLTDVQYGLRQWKRNPMLTSVAVLSLALGIGANTAIFSLLDQIVLRLLPVEEPGRLVLFHNTGIQPGRSSSDNPETVWSYPMYKDLHDRNRVFSGVAARSSASVSLRHGDESERASAELVSGNLFEVLGVRPALGRLFGPEDDRAPGAHPVIVLTHGYWKRRFGASAAILNQTVQINGHAMTVVGVAPEGLRSVVRSGTPDLYLPINMKRQATPTWDGLAERRVMWLTIFARLAPGVSTGQAEAAMQSVFRPILDEELAQMGSRGARFRERFLAGRLLLRPGADGVHDMRQQYGTAVFALMGLVGFVLLIACANVANLLLYKAAGQRRQIAIRMAVGASRRRIVRLLLVESTLLAVAGAALGLIVSVWTMEALLWIGGQEARMLVSTDIDPRTLAFTGAVALATGFLLGMTPAWKASRFDVNAALKEQSGTLQAHTAQARFRRILVGAQVAFSVVLLAAAGLFSQSLLRLMHVEPGFETSRILHFRLAPKLNGYDAARSNAFFERLQQRLSQLLRVESAGMAEISVLTNSNRDSNVTVEGYQAKEEEDTVCGQNPISPAYFRTLGIPLIAGREFNERDQAGSPKAVIVNQSFVRYFFKDQNPIGRRMTFGAGTVKLDREIVGVVRDSKAGSLEAAIPRMVYIPYTQDPALPSLAVYVRTAASLDAVTREVRAVVRELDANIPVYEMTTLDRQVEESVTARRMLAWLSNAFAGLALLLASIGIYGVIAHSVTIRTGEIGIRMALGAARRDIVGMVLGEVGFLLAGGIAVGMLLTIWLGRYLASELYQVKAYDPLVLASAAAIIAMVALGAGYLPARRAAGIDPIGALRHQ